ncbi:MAG: 4Fe-4S binding protein [Patescibacteria group bacterium]|nr:4Fe-4S binding protein [Patescibacteria group bacterium]MDD5164063.1 4Fe-4S binding protein [Patescibacteria group bacterium]MDD5534853.1 4Fe-4S binding protein [Patescibacteria group bacterium]
MTEKNKILIGGIIDKPGSSKDYKTGSWRSQVPVWDKKKCIQCLVCVNYCPENCIPLKEDKRVETDFDYCKGCGICAQVCPVKAIIMKEGK